VLEGVKDLSSFIAKTEADFARLPVFAGPMANMGLRRKSGQGLKEWKTAATRLEALLSGGGAAAAGGSGAVVAGLKAEVPVFVRLLEGLIEYVRGAPAETARFTRDEETLRQVAEEMVRRPSSTESPAITTAARSPPRARQIPFAADATAASRHDRGPAGQGVTLQTDRVS